MFTRRRILLIINFRESVNDISDYKRPKLPGAKGNKPGSKGAKPKGGKNKRNQRYGKMRRQKTKGKKQIICTLIIPYQSA